MRTMVFLLVLLVVLMVALIMVIVVVVALLLITDNDGVETLKAKVDMEVIRHVIPCHAMSCGAFERGDVVAMRQISGASEDHTEWFRHGVE